MNLETIKAWFGLQTTHDIKRTILVNKNSISFVTDTLNVTFPPKTSPFTGQIRIGNKYFRELPEVILAAILLHEAGHKRLLNNLIFGIAVGSFVTGLFVIGLSLLASNLILGLAGIVFIVLFVGITWLSEFHADYVSSRELGYLPLTEALKEYRKIPSKIWPPVLFVIKWLHPPDKWRYLLMKKIVKTSRIKARVRLVT
ncbi:MAG: hypothetical protein NTY90_04455 [Candidatus Micrarchaeota archaeon]|nr:hypothetical protein [Candidatus Micrarchaeota archaeon]